MIPKPIYELLPTFYVLCGITAMLVIESFMSFISGLLMGLSGVLIVFMRRNYRLSKQLFLKKELQPE
jgi:hypothetical protein